MSCSTASCTPWRRRRVLLSPSPWPERPVSPSPIAPERRAVKCDHAGSAATAGTATTTLSTTGIHGVSLSVDQEHSEGDDENVAGLRRVRRVEPESARDTAFAPIGVAPLANAGSALTLDTTARRSPGQSFSESAADARPATDSDPVARITGFPTPVKLSPIPTKDTPRRVAMSPVTSWRNVELLGSQLTNEGRSGVTGTPPCRGTAATAMLSCTMTPSQSTRRPPHVDVETTSGSLQQVDLRAATTTSPHVGNTTLLCSPSVSLIQSSLHASRHGRSAVLDGTTDLETLATMPGAVDDRVQRADYYFSAIPCRTSCEPPATRSVATQTAAPSSTKYARLSVSRASAHTAAIDSWMV